MPKNKRGPKGRGRYGDGCLFRRPAVNGTFWYKIPNPAGGKPIAESCKTKDPDEARACKARALADLHGSTAGKKKGGTIGELLDNYIESLKANKESPDTAENVEAVINKHIRPPFGHRQAADLKTPELRAYRKAKARDLSKGTLNLHMTYIRRAFNLGREDGNLDDVPIPFFPMAKLANERKGWLPPDGYLKMLNELQPSLKILFVFGYHLGIRIGELLQYRWDMVDFNNWVINVPARVCKNREGRKVHVIEGGGIRELFIEQRAIQQAKCKRCPWVFFWHPGATGRAGGHIISYRDSWTAARERAGFQALMVHDLRRTAATLLVEEYDLSMEDAILITGHKDTGMLKRYLQERGKKTKIQYDKIGPGFAKLMARSSEPRNAPEPANQVQIGDKISNSSGASA